MTPQFLFFDETARLMVPGFGINALFGNYFFFVKADDANEAIFVAW